MAFINLLDAQIQAVQQVIARKPLDVQLADTTDPTQQNILKSQIRQIQWALTQANNFIIEGGLLPLAYDINTSFDNNGDVITPWNNENIIPGTHTYVIVSSTPSSQQELLVLNADNVAQLNTLIYESQVLLAKNQNIVHDAYALPDSDPSKSQKLTTAQANVIALQKQIISLTNQLQVLQGQSLVLPSQQASVSGDAFSLGIRQSLQTILNNKISYVPSSSDVDAVMGMRRRVLDAYYTATTDVDRQAAQQRIDTTVAALAPNIPVSRGEMSGSDLFIDTIVFSIGDLNEELKPKQITLDEAFISLQLATISGSSADISAAQLVYDVANADYNVTLDEIRKKYEALLGFHNSFGASAAFPGSLDIQQYTPKPNPSYYGEGAYPLVWDTKEKQFVSPDQAKGDPGRYISTTYTNQAPNAKQSDNERMQSILSQKYLTTAQQAADFNYQRSTQDAIFQNQNRTTIIAGQQQDLTKLQSEFEARKADPKTPITDTEFLQYQTKINTLQADITTNKNVIAQNNSIINAAQEQRLQDSNPTILWDKVQSDVAVSVGASTSVAAVQPNALQEAQNTASKFYDAEAERQIAQRQYNTAEGLTNTSQQAAIAEATARGVTDPTDPANWNAALKADYETKRGLQLQAKDTLYTANSTFADATVQANNIVQSALADPTNSGKQLLLKQSGLTPFDIQKAQLVTSPDNITNSRDALIDSTTKQYMQQRDADLNSAQIGLQSAIGLAAQHAGSSDPSKWSDADKAVVDAANAKVAQAQQASANSATDAAAHVDAIIQAAQKEQTGNKFSNTGFEGINNSAPFYMQFPTLNSITDFRLKNGIDPYGNKSPDEIARDAVVFKIFETVPTVDRAESVSLDNGGKYITNIPGQTNINTIGSFTIYPAHEDKTGDWLMQSHKHSYSNAEGGITSLINTGLEALGSAESALQLVNAGLGAAATGRLKGNDPAGNVYKRKVDVLDYYQDTEKQSIPIRFNLFTKNNFLNDVYRPIMFLTALGYPKRALKGDLGDITGDTLKKTIQLLKSNENSSYAKFLLEAIGKLAGTDDTNSTVSAVNGLADNVSSFVNNLESAVGSFGGIGPYRYFISKRPEYLTVRHASGLFYFPIAYINTFTYRFKGPWYNFDGKPLAETKDLDALISTQIKQLVPPSSKTFKETVNGIFTNTAQGIQDAFRAPPKAPPTPPKAASRPGGTPGGLLSMSQQDLAFIHQSGLPFAYPSWAECEITITNAVPFFRDDFMALYYASQKGGNDLVSITQQMTLQQQFASGGRKTIDNQADTAFNSKNPRNGK